jgi:DDE_Tnp_1-associated
MPTQSKAPGPLDIPDHFARIPDPRHPSCREIHLLGDIVTVALCAVLSEATSWENIAAFGNRKLQWLRSLVLKLANGVPGYDTFNRVFAPLDPQSFRVCFRG